MNNSKAIDNDRRFYVDTQCIKNSQVSIEGPDANHIKNVLRMKSSDTISLFDGLGSVYSAQITSISTDLIELKIINTSKEPKPDTQIILAQGYLKDKKMDILIRQLTELGITQFIPFMSERSIPNPDSKRIKKRLERWKKITQESLKQCKRNCLPEIKSPVSYKNMIELGNNCDLKIIFWEDESLPLKKILSSFKKKPKKILIVLGPEGGFSADEIKTAQKNNFISASLGSSILRAETASITALAIIQFFFNDMG